MVPRKTCNRILPQPLVRWLRELRFAALDTLDRWCGRADDLTPPRSLQHFVGGAYQALGEAFFSHFQNLCHLRPDQSVLDVGCGSGRMAVPLLGYLDQRGRYVGFDISPKLIRWCSGHISRRNANFTFHLADIYNRHYNPRGACRASEYRFPCEDRTIDFVFATSVFTHMLADDTRHYLHEIRRVLKPGGHGLLTHFILNAESEAAMNRSPEGASSASRSRTASRWTLKSRSAGWPSPRRRCGRCTRRPICGSRSRSASGNGPAGPGGCRIRTLCWSVPADGSARRPVAAPGNRSSAAARDGTPS